MLATCESVDGRWRVVCYDERAAGPGLLSDDDPVVVRRELVDAAGVARLDQDVSPRWIFDSIADSYPALLDAGVRLLRGHDIAAVERILLSREGLFGQPCRAAAVCARAAGLVPPPDRASVRTPVADRGQQELFGDDQSRDTQGSASANLVAAYQIQMLRVIKQTRSVIIDGVETALAPGALKLLLAAESGSCFVAAEMTRRGLPWDAQKHEKILIDKLGPRPALGDRPRNMAALQLEISRMFGFDVNPDSAMEVKNAFHRAGFAIDSTRAWVLQELDHPAVAPLIAYKELARLYSANGWNWLESWVSDGRLVSEYLPGEVVSGRWATRGGGGLQLPKLIRPAAVAEPGNVFVVADAAQLEPRVLAAISGDSALAAAAEGHDLYASIASDGFGGDRSAAKLAMLGAMYGQTTGEAARLMATMRRTYPRAIGVVDGAAERGETGHVVSSVLGRMCPPPSAAWRSIVGGSGGDDGRARRMARGRGRFTRNFVIQASAADWAAVWMTLLRLALLEVDGAEMVFFQHDEIVMHLPAAAANDVCRQVVSTADRATQLVFPDTSVRIPVRPETVACYADAK